MIISIRGTSGSGKTTIAKKICELYEHRMGVMIPERRRAIRYHLQDPDYKTLDVIGHYETACGGCDTILKYSTIFEQIREAHENNDVLFEGLLVSAEYRNTFDLIAEGYDVRILRLTTPMEQCLESINQRRRAKNPNLGPVKPRNTLAKDRAVNNSLARLKEAHGDKVQIYEVNRQECEDLIKEWLQK